ncbi:hypothetical protein F9L33_03775 [Amylibacter sp. SFDW26]|uniref:hypothetical protein n=1 Tax=Amylibacter sp. SFDW26 TaxID=2652722 RepID=UPI001262890A|nr:hypothetical protein [Amylibacter sp. SFDW26]KAB7615889.1 hypothetical protein F9L33_03775 [Amylibacter sp. SFDW26]
MTAILKCDLPDESLLSQYGKDTGAYVDCFCVDVPKQVNLEDYITAFYTTPLFKLERLLLKLASYPSTDRDVIALAANQSDRFAAWKLVERTQKQIFLNAGRTSSWLHVDKNEQGARLYFGSAVANTTNAKTGKTEMGFLFSALLGFHILYSRALLWSAQKRLST